MRKPSAFQRPAAPFLHARALPLALSFSLLALSGCGGSESDPDDVTVLKLKTPMELSAMPLEKSLFLRWFANNNESDFSGYNVYVSTAPKDEIVKAFGLARVDEYDPHVYSPVRFRDDEQDEIESVRANLSKYFNWDPLSRTFKPGDGETFGPLARCNVTTTDRGGECKAVTGATQGNRANGVISYTIPQGLLSPDREYAVFVASTQDDGEEIGGVTSNVVFVRPHEVLTLPQGMTFRQNGTGVELDGVDLNPDAPAKTSGIFPNATRYCLPTGPNDAAKTIDVYLESLLEADPLTGSQVQAPYLTSANGARISTLGNVVGEDGAILTGREVIEGTERPDSQVLVPGVETAKPANTAPEPSDMGADVGYGRCGQSQKVIAGNLYAVAFPDGKGGWRYALIKAPDAPSELTTADKYLLVVGREGERRL